MRGCGGARARRGCGALALVALTLACGASQPTTPGRPTLQAVDLPEISRAAAPVQEQIRARYATLQTSIDRTDTSSMELAAAYGEMGKLFIAAEYYDAAHACFDNARALAPDDMRWPYFLGHVFRFKNDQGRAAASFEESRRLAPDHVPTLVWLAEMHLAQSRPEQAESLLMDAQSRGADNGAVAYGLGRAALARQSYARAVEYLEGALALAPQATRVHYPLALAYRGLGNPAKAEAHLRLRGETDLPPFDPLLGEVAGLLQNASAYETRGSKAIESREWAEAVENLTKAAEIAPANAFTRLNLGTALYMQGNADRALQEYREAVRLSPGLARAHFGIGALLETRGQDEEAIAAFRAAVSSDPGYVEARFSLANALRRSGRVSESLTHYDEVLRANPAVSQASFGYAMALVRLGRYQEARDRLQQAVTSFPDQPGFTHALARLLAAAPDDRVRDGTRALSIMNELMKVQQTLAMAETMAMALAEAGRFEEAARWQRDAIAAARDAKQDEVTRRLSANLLLYQNGKPVRTPWADDDPVHRPVPAP